MFAKKFIKTIFVNFLCLIFIFNGLIACSKHENNMPVVSPSIKNKVIETSRIMATIAADEKPDTDINHAPGDSSAALPTDMLIEISPYGNGSAYIAKVGNRVCVVHNGKRGKLYDKVIAYTLAMSPNGQRIAYGAQVGDKHYVVIDGVEKGPFTDRGRIAFSPDSKHIAYDAQVNGSWYMFVDDYKHDGSVSYYDKAVFSSDSSMLSYIETKDDTGSLRLVTSDVKFLKNHSITLADPVIAISADKKVVAAVEKSNDKQRAYIFDFNNPSLFKYGELYDEIKQLTLSNDGKSLAYIALKDSKKYIVLNDKVGLLPDADYPWPMAVRPDSKSVGVFVVNEIGKNRFEAYLHEAFDPAKKRNKVYKEGAYLTYSGDGKHYAYVAIYNERFTIVIDGKEGTFFDRTITPHFSPDGKFLVYRARQDGKRFVVIADINGKIIKKSPPYERVFDTVFTEDGKSVAYGVLDGNQIMWKVEKL